VERHTDTPQRVDEEVRSLCLVSIDSTRTWNRFKESAVFKDHPPGVKVLFFTEMWERFGYYLMLGILVLYMRDTVMGGLGFSYETAAEVYGTFIALVYLTPFFGGMLADRRIGYRRSVVTGGILMGIGYLMLAIPGTKSFFLALGVIALGNGFFKPNMSTLVGRLYPADSPLRDAGYNIFYMGVNIGAFICNFVAALLRNRFGWGWAFAAAGVGMFLAVLIFISNQRLLRDAPDRGDGSDIEEGVVGRLVAQVVLPAVVAGTIGYLFLGPVFGSATNAAFVFAALPVLVYYAVLWLRAPREEKGPIGALLSIFAVVVIFWMIFHQNGSTLTFWTEENTRREAGLLAPALTTLHLHQDATIGVTIQDPDAQGSYWRNVPADRRPAEGVKVTLVSTELFQSINPFFIIIFTPLVVAFFAWLRQRGREPSTPAKIAWGMVITAVSTVFMIGAVVVSHGGLDKVSPLWLLGTYAVITVGELFLSPMGLALVSKLAPARVTALMMGGWYLATSIGNKLAGVLAGFWERIPLLGIFSINLVAALLAAIAIALMTPRIRRIMAEHAERTEP
jgi:POT family proton-dependent oligopeptide transporter